MNRILVLLPNPSFHKYLPPIGFAYLFAILKKYKYKFYVIDNNDKKLSNFEILEYIKNKKINIVISSTVYRFYNNCPTFAINQSYELAKTIKQNLKEIKIICIGHLTQLYKLKLLEFFDYLIKGEFEEVIVELLEYLNFKSKKLSDINGLIYKFENKIIETPSAKYPDLNNLPIPDRSFLNMEKYIFSSYFKSKITSVITSRGCPYNCSYCFSARDSIKQNDNLGKQYRIVPEEKTIEEIKGLVDNYNIKGFKIEDIEFCVDKEHVKKLCELLIKNKLNHLVWRAVTRVTSIDKSLLELMYRAGCRSLYYGVESGSQKVLDATGKGITKKEIQKIFDLTQKAKIQADASFLFGVPEDSRDSIIETIEFSKKLNSGFATYHIFCPFPGIPLLKNLNKTFKFENLDNLDVYNVTSKKVFCEVSYDELNVLKKKAYREYYFSFNFIKKLFKSIFTYDLIKYIYSGFMKKSEANWAIKLILGKNK